MIEALDLAEKEMAGQVVSDFLPTGEDQSDSFFSEEPSEVSMNSLPDSSAGFKPFAELAPSKEEDSFFAMYGKDAPQNIASPPPEEDIQKAIFYDLYYRQEKPDQAFQFLKFYFLESFQVAELDDERNGLFEYVLEIGHRLLYGIPQNFGRKSLYRRSKQPH